MSILLVEEKINSYLKEIGNINILEILNTIQKGKMLRSRLILAIAPNNPQSIDLCAIVEMIHLASLLHDDVIDEADTRRGTPSINSLYDNKMAIMLGDILYSLAFSKLVNFEQKISQKISQAVTTISIGEFLDVELSKTLNTDLDKYMDMLYKKTSSLIQACSYSGAILANKNADALSSYGKYLGISFQLVDDLLDITQDSQTLGKPAMNDFKEGKVTIPYILLLECLDNEKKQILKDLYKKELDEKQIQWLKNEFQTNHIKEKSLEHIMQYAKQAKDSIPQDEKELQNLLLKAIDREF